jgi:hypothetical protein
VEHLADTPKRKAGSPVDTRKWAGLLLGDSGAWPEIQVPEHKRSAKAVGQS